MKSNHDYNTKSFYKNKTGFPSQSGRKRGYFLFLMLIPLLGSGGLFAQSDWQWGRRGGSTTTHQNGNSFEESIVDMATDPAGNVYIISNVGGQNLDVDGQTYTFHHAYGFAGPRDDDPGGLIASFDCDGGYRWGQLISGTICHVSEIEADTLGNVYVTGGVLPGKKDIYFGDLYEAHFGNDTVIPYSPNPKKYKKKYFLARYDILGNLEQLIMPQADSSTFGEVSNSHIYFPIDLVADPDGTQHWFWRLQEEDAGGNQYTPNFEGDTLTKGFYVFRYDHQGSYLGEVKLEMHTVDKNNALSQIWINHDPVSGSYYLTGYNMLYQLAQNGQNYSLHIGGQLVDSPMFVAKFDSLGQSEWMVQGDKYIYYMNNKFDGGAQIDNQGNIYLSGTMHGSPIATFNGYSAQNDIIDRAFPVLICIGPAGNLLWGAHAETQGGASGMLCYTSVSGNQVVFTSSISDIVWGNVTYPGKPNSGLNSYLARFDKTTGNFISMDSIGSDFGYNEYPTAIASGPRGNIYVGGEFQSKMYVGGDVLQNINVPPSGTDFFVAKFGQNNCNCTLPEAKFTFSGNGNGTVNFTYTGTSAYDELEWGFGNGQTLTTTMGNTSQTYTSDEEYWVCVTAYNNCGHDTWCTMIEPYSLSLPPLSKSNFQVYPNPVRDQLNIGATETLSYRLFSISGKELLSGQVEKGRNPIFVGTLPSGSYILLLENRQGRKTTVKVVKE